MLRARVVTAIVVVTLFIAALFYLPSRGWDWFVLTVAMIGIWEWGRVAGYTRSGTAWYCGVTLSIALALMATMVSAEQLRGLGMRPLHQAILLLAGVFWLLVAPLWLGRGWKVRSALVLAVTGWVVVLPAWLALGYLHRVSPWFLLSLAALVWIADVAAYFAGRRFGKRKLAPHISPGKTWEGVAGALLAVSLYYLGMVLGLGGFQAPGIALPGSAAAALFWLPAVWLLTGISIVGDLFESWLKRTAGVKDSGSILPGHGGILDRIDALVATLPVALLLMMVYAAWQQG